jgi:hypothetical protein
MGILRLLAGKSSLASYIAARGRGMQVTET